MSWRRTALLAAVAGAALTGAGCGQATQAGAGAAMAGGGFGLPKYTAWQIVAAPDIPGNGDVLGGLAMTGPADGWAVGYREGADDYPEPMIARWNGTTWRLESLPASVAGQLDTPYSLSASSPGNVWMLADDSTQSGAGKLAHWNGTTWSLPTIDGLSSDALWDRALPYAAAGSDELWVASGSAQSPTTDLLHVTGGESVHVPLPAGFTQVRSIQAVSATDVWFAGVGGASGRDPVIARWNGTRLTVVPTPAVPSVAHDDTEFSFSSFAGAGDGWVLANLVEWGEDGPYSVAKVSWYWNGTAWTSKVVPGPPDTRGYRLLTADGNGGLWATMNDGESEVPAPPHNMWHYVPGKRWQKSIAPTWNGFNLEVSRGAMIPGTNDLFVTGDLMKWTEPRQAQAVILRGNS